MTGNPVPASLFNSSFCFPFVIIDLMSKMMMMTGMMTRVSEFMVWGRFRSDRNWNQETTVRHRSSVIPLSQRPSLHLISHVTPLPFLIDPICPPGASSVSGSQKPLWRRKRGNETGRWAVGKLLTARGARITLCVRDRLRATWRLPPA